MPFVDWMGNVLYRLMYLNSWSPAGIIVLWNLSEDEESCQRKCFTGGWALRLNSCISSHCFCSLHTVHERHFHPVSHTCLHSMSYYVGPMIMKSTALELQGQPNLNCFWLIPSITFKTNIVRQIYSNLENVFDTGIKY